MSYPEYNPDSDLYELLGVRDTASPEELKKAYRKKAQEVHPDRRGGDPASQEAMKSVNLAFDTLNDPTKRKEYDQSRERYFTKLWENWSDSSQGQSEPPSPSGSKKRRRRQNRKTASTVHASGPSVSRAGSGSTHFGQVVLGFALLAILLGILLE